ncbi:MAG: hypothetical protein H6727_14620 [Myxococcales bacterium]|nr:hypothetical protein [Myxococcales bacterium]
MLHKFIPAGVAIALCSASLVQAAPLPQAISYRNATGPLSIEKKQILTSERAVATFRFGSGFCGVRVGFRKALTTPQTLRKLQRSIVMLVHGPRPTPLYAKLQPTGLLFQPTLVHPQRRVLSHSGLVHVISTKPQSLRQTLQSILGAGQATIRQVSCGPRPPMPVATKKSPCGRNSSFRGRKTITGKIHYTKGRQLMLKGHVISPFPGFKGRRYGGLRAGQDVTLRADVCMYRCHPMEQCLRGGIIPTLRNARIVKIHTP